VQPGTGAFKDAILGTLTPSVLGVVALEASAVKTFDGRALSAVLATLNAGFKESIREASGALEEPRVADKLSEATATGLDTSSAGAAGAISGEGGKGKLIGETKGAVHVGVARGDPTRLLAELKGEDLFAVRIALKMPAAEPATGSCGFAALTARSLLSFGVSAGNFVAQGYPEARVDVPRKATLEQLRQIV
jgi:hypothetical protein